MATSPLARVAATSIDIAGISVSTATPGIDPRAGSIYNLTDLAAAAPVWFHPVANGRHLMLNSRRWYNATPDGGAPGVFASYSEDLMPSWTVIDGPTGHRTPVLGFLTSIPTNISPSGRVLTAAASRPSECLFLLSSLTDTPGALLQRFNISGNGRATLAMEEILPTLVVGEDTVAFDRGVQYTMPWLYLYGTDSLGRIYRIRKAWAHIGVNKPRVVSKIHYNVASMPQGWEYFTGTGWSLDPAEVVPMPLFSDGPMSFALYRSVVLMTTVRRNEDNTYDGLIWRSNSSRPFTQMGDPVPLGSSDDDSYLGGGIQLTQLGANPDLPAMVGVTAGIVYVTSVKTGTSLVNRWDLAPIAL